jgi:hypothetical protein
MDRLLKVNSCIDAVTSEAFSISSRGTFHWRAAS